MKTITMTIEESILSKAEQKAAALETSVDAVVSEYLRKWTDEDEVRQGREAMMEHFGKRDWKFTVGTPDDREQRNART